MQVGLGGTANGQVCALSPNTQRELLKGKEARNRACSSSVLPESGWTAISYATETPSALRSGVDTSYQCKIAGQWKVSLSLRDTEVVVFLCSLVGLIHCTGPQRAVLHCFSKGIAVGTNCMEHQCCCTLNRDIKCTLKHRVSVMLPSTVLSTLSVHPI